MQDPGAETVEIFVNGEKRSAPVGQSLLVFLESLGLDPSRVAVEMDGRIVKKAEWPDTLLHAGTRLEIVQFVGGG
jgi:thiamine biosynthesis protein ThiS